MGLDRYIDQDAAIGLFAFVYGNKRGDGCMASETGQEEYESGESGKCCHRLRILLSVALASSSASWASISPL